MSPEQQKAFDRVLVNPESGCWLWTSYVDEIGYGIVGTGGRNVKAHRYSWSLFRGKIPKGKKVLHRCDVRNCINPNHLFIGTQLDNVRDCIAKGRWRNGPQHGEANAASKLSWSLVQEMRRIRKETNLAYKHIAPMFGVSTMTAFRAVTGQSWKRKE